MPNIGLGTDLSIQSLLMPNIDPRDSFVYLESSDAKHWLRDRFVYPESSDAKH